MITFEVEESIDAQKIVTWDQVAFKDGKEDEEPVKSIHVEVNAGGVLEMVVERYVIGNHTTLNENSENVPLTKKSRHAILKDDSDIKLRVSKAGLGKFKS